MILIFIKNLDGRGVIVGVVGITRIPVVYGSSSCSLDIAVAVSVVDEYLGGVVYLICGGLPGTAVS